MPFTDDWQLPDPWPVAGADLTFLANPNSPSGTVVDRGGDRTAGRTRSAGPLVLDEAYVDFAEWNGLRLAASATEPHRHADAEQVVRAGRHPLRLRGRRPGSRSANWSR